MSSVLTVSGRYYRDGGSLTFACQTLTVLSSEPETMYGNSPTKVAKETFDVWPSRVLESSPLPLFQIFTSASVSSQR